MTIEFSKHTTLKERKEILNFYRKKPVKKKKPNKKVKLKGAAKRKAMPYNLFLRSKYWQTVRYKVLFRDGFKCTECNERSPLIVHHKTYKNHGNEHKHLKDLITLCDMCHDVAHNRKTKK